MKTDWLACNYFIRKSAKIKRFIKKITVLIWKSAKSKRYLKLGCIVELISNKTAINVYNYAQV